MLSQISGTSIGDSSIQNRNRVLLLQRELTAEGVWDVGKWLGAAYAGDEANVLARIRSLEDRDKARGDKQDVAGNLQGSIDNCKDEIKALDLLEESCGLSDEANGRRKLLF
ncbi:hypothetical protein Ancab_037001, partial [Ancistrocladus abbreviatus]